MDSRAWVYGNLAESLFSLGRWDEAETAALKTRRLALGTKPRGTAANRLAQLALARGEWDTAERELAAAREHYGAHNTEPQYTLQVAGHAIELAAARGRILEVRALLRQVVEAGFPPGMQRYAWRLLYTAAAAESAARGLPTAEPGRGEALAHLRAAVKRVPQPVPVWRAHAAMVQAELARAEGRNRPDLWAEATAAFATLDRPYPLAHARHRWAEALLTPARGAHGQGASGSAASGQGASGLGALGQRASGQGASGQGASGQGAPGQGASGQGAPGQRASGQGAPGHALGQGAHGQRASGQAASGQGALAQGASGQAAPARVLRAKVPTARAPPPRPIASTPPNCSPRRMPWPNGWAPGRCARRSSCWPGVPGCPWRPPRPAPRSTRPGRAPPRCPRLRAPRPRPPDPPDPPNPPIRQRSWG
ncbi:hypothetical protein SVIO_075120 [Streptomyces violaceusniger]|uniref:Uncharacterized protein n=1 Tax=Streptomyces violaceusniger TaxID=68280 RepID=A0A4D4LG76_STRVO|nr:hypothetical protein SVIO_075120 [Streptomyces violaceusniger]